MWYIYKEGTKVKFSTTEPDVTYFTTKLPPKPNLPYLELKADFEKQTVWWGQKELTKEEQDEIRAEAIKQDLQELDEKITRVEEDIIEELNKTTGYMPYSTTIEVINHKEDLRDELKSLTKEVIADES